MRYAPEIPAELDRIVAKTLEKDREERYQVVKDLALDLKRLKQRLEFETELAQIAPPEERNGSDRQVVAEKELALTWLERGFAAVRSVSFIKMSRCGARRSDPRFAVLLRGMGITP
jgi:hypothetical protein